MRQKRKLDHLNLANLMEDGPALTGFNDINFVPNCIPEISYGETNTAVSFLGRKFKAPFLINAISGGIPEAASLNRALARVARSMDIPMAVGSMTAALKDPAVLYTYAAVREENPDGFIAANVSAGIPPGDALKAVQLIKADALQLHLNAPQEVSMPEGEGDLSFRGLLDNIGAVVKSSSVPVIVKEVGFGIAQEQAKQIIATGANALDTGGCGGTNFIRIESFRGNYSGALPFYNWGIPSAITLLEVAQSLETGNSTAGEVEIVATGGIRSGLDTAKALALGAKMTGLAGPLVQAFYRGGEQTVLDYLMLLQRQLKQTMFMLGVKGLAELKNRPLLILGDTGKWLELRGIKLQRLARRDLDLG